MPPGPRRDGMRQPPAPPFLFPGSPQKPNTGGGGSPALVPQASPFSASPKEVKPDYTFAYTPGGELLFGLQNPTFTTTEELYRVLPEEAWFDPSVSPSRPIQFELGSFTVPQNQDFWIYDYQFQVYVQSGLDPGDILPAAAGRFGNIMGFDLTVSGRRFSHLVYQLDPVPVSTQRQSFELPTGSRDQPASVFNRAAFQSFAANASPGLSLLPLRREIQGVPRGPFTLVAKQNDRVALSTVIFRPVPSPLACIEGRVLGWLLPSVVSKALIERLKPR